MSSCNPLFEVRLEALSDWQVQILCIIFRPENPHLRIKWYVEYDNVLLNLISQWNLCQNIAFYGNQILSRENPPVAVIEILEISLYQID